MLDNAYTSALLFMAGVCLYSAFQHGTSDHRVGNRRAHLLFALVALLASLLAVSNAMVFRATTVPGYIASLRVNLAAAILIYALLLCFVAEYTRRSPTLVLAGWYVLYGLLFFVNLSQPYTLQHKEIHGLGSMGLPWGEQITVVQASPSVWFFIGVTASPLSLVFAIYLLAARFRRDGHRASMIMMFAVGVCLVTAAEGALTRLGIIHFVPLGPFGFLGMIVMMGITLNHETREQHKRAEDARKASEERLHLAARAGSIGIWDWDVQHNKLIWDDSMYALYGVRREDFGGAYEAWSRTLHPDDRQFAEGEIQAALRGEREYSPEFRIVRPDGSVQIVKAASQTFRDPKGKPLRMIGTNIDITERKRIERELEQSQANLTALIENTTDLIWSVDRNYSLLTFNTLLKEHFRKSYGTEARIGATAEMLLPPDRAVMWKPLFERAINDGPYRMEYHLTDDRILELSVHPIVQNGECTAISVFGKDITERKQAEEELEKHRHHLEEIVARRTEELEAAKDVAERANRAKSMFLANMSHEIRTPMNAMLGFAQLLARDPSLSPAAHAKLSTILKSGEHLLAIINDILEMSRIESGRIEVRVESVDLRSLLDDLAVMFRLRAEEKGVAITLDCGPGIPAHVLVDLGKLRQVLTNLLGNAVKFTPKGAITLRGSSIGPGRIAVEVQDTGIGISPEDQEWIFNAFARARTGEEIAGGTGLGLAISREYARAMGGEISVTSRVGEGSRFRFEFQARVTEVVPIAAKSARRVAGLAPGQEGIRVLVVDDRELNRNLLRQILTPFGFVVDEACDGEEAIAKVKAHAPRVVLMDMIMPGMDGIEATRILRRSCADKSMVIIGISASAFEESKQMFLDAGIHAFISKPIREQELLDLLAEHAGVVFQVEGTHASSSNGQAIQPKPTLDKMPAEWRSAFVHALSLGSITRIRTLGKEAATLDPALTDWLLGRLASYDLAALRTLCDGMTMEIGKPDGG